MSKHLSHDKSLLQPPCDNVVNLEVAMRVLTKLAYEDGDLGAEYWNSVMRLLSSAGEMHTELLELRRTLRLRRR